MIIPTLEFEAAAWRKQLTLIGIDEVGRGALAGPIVVGAVIFPIDHLPHPKITDSKLLTATRRTELAAWIKQQAAAWQCGTSSVVEINELGINPATCLAASRAVTALQGQLINQGSTIVVDGNPLKSWPQQLTQCTQFLPKADQKVYTVAAASIVAKVHRDTYMEEIGQVYPDYGWTANKGYGTAQHRRALQTNGSSQHHRQLFIRKILAE